MSQNPNDEKQKDDTNNEEPIYNRKTTVYQVLEKVDLSGKLYVVTGTNSGIGKITAKALALKGATIICCVRDVKKMQEIIQNEFLTDENKDKLKKEQFVIQPVDLMDLQDVSKASKDIAKKYEKIDGIVANAGVMFPPERRETKDGFEYHLGTNYVSHFVMANILLDNLSRAKPSRLVVVSAIAHRWCPGINFDDINLTKDYDKYVAYGQSCAARCMFATEFNRRYADKGVLAFSVHPGVILTGLQKDFTTEDYKKLHILDENGNISKTFKDYVEVTPDQGAATQVWALVSPKLKDHGGAFLMDCQVAPEWDGKPQNYVGYSKWLYDEKNGKKLWDQTAESVSKFL